MRPDGRLTTLFRPTGNRFVGDVDLHFDGDRLLFSMRDARGRWQIHELRADGSGLRELPLIIEPDVDNYDACYLPSGKIVFTSTACFIGVPCVYGSSHVTNLYVCDPDGRNIRQLTFEQPDLNIFPCLRLTIEAGKNGRTYPAVACAADEVAVELFLSRRIGFSDIARLVEQALEKHQASTRPSLEDILAADAWARENVLNLLKSL